MRELDSYLAAWSESADDVLALAGELDDADWARQTDCPGWSVHDVLAHLAALERELATGEPPTALAPLPGRALADSWTEAGVAQRRGVPSAEVVAEYAAQLAARREQLAAQPPTDPEGRPERTPGGVTWDNRTLLRNRALDTWVHNQDIRRAVGRPGAMTGAGAELVEGVFDAAWPYVLAKRAGAPAGTRLRVVLGGERRDYAVGPDGRGTRVPEADVPDAAEPDAAEPDVTITLDREALCVLGAGRRPPEDLPATARLSIAGDADLARRILLGLNLTS